MTSKLDRSIRKTLALIGKQQKLMSIGLRRPLTREEIKLNRELSKQVADFVRTLEDGRKTR